MSTPEQDPAVVDLSRGLLPEIPELGEELAERIRDRLADDAVLGDWVGIGTAYARSLPPKPDR